MMQFGIHTIYVWCLVNISYVQGEIENSAQKTQINTVDYKNYTADFVNHTVDYKNRSVDLRLQHTVFNSSAQMLSFYFVVCKKSFSVE